MWNFKLKFLLPSKMQWFSGFFFFVISWLMLCLSKMFQVRLNLCKLKRENTEQKFTDSSCWDYLFLSRRWAIWRCCTRYPKWTIYNLYMTHGAVSPVTQTSQEPFGLYTGIAQTRAASWKLLKQVIWKSSVLLLDPVAFSKEWQHKKKKK